MTDTNNQFNDVPEMMKNRRFHLLFDKSGSMNDPEGSSTRWKTLGETAKGLMQLIVPIAQELEVITFSSAIERQRTVTPEWLESMFRSVVPNGGTNTHLAFDEMFKNYLNDRNANRAPSNGGYAFVFTDGAASDRAALAKSIKDFTQHLRTPQEWNITFLQVGHDSQASKDLSMLDDDLEAAGAKYDIVDVVRHEDFGGRNPIEVIKQGIYEHKQAA